MPVFIGSFEHEGKRYFVEHSTISDAPQSAALLKEEFIEYYCKHSPYKKEHALEELEPRLIRAAERGSSAIQRETFEDLILCNRVGDREATLNPEEYKRLVLSWRSNADD